MKITSLTFKKKYSGDNEEDFEWITLGHIDEMYSEVLQNASIDMIQEKNISFLKEKIPYHHSIYLFGNDKNEDFIKNSENSYFLAVTRIHFPKFTCISEMRGMYETELSEIKEKEEEYKKLIKYCLYRTTELSDLVLISRCKLFNTLIKWTMQVTESTYVGSSYTYYCIPYAMVSCPENYPYLGRETIDSLTVRFKFIKNAEKSNTILNFLKELPSDNWKLLRISGNEDYQISFHQIDTQSVLKLYKLLYELYKENSDEVYTITRVGNRRGSISPISSEKEENWTNYIIAFENELSSSVKNYNPKTEDEAWYYPLIELSDTLINMSKSVELDELCLQILPAVFAFLKNINNKNNTKEIEEEIEENGKDNLTFVESCVHALEHLMRSEWQLSQRPDMRPIVYDIPVCVLEYSMAFLISLRGALSKDDEADKPYLSNIAFLLSPAATTDVSTVELFEAREKTPGLLEISVPFSLLYKPTKLLAALSHEVSHYVGEKIRFRDKRRECFIRCLSEEIVFYLTGIYVDELTNGKDFLDFLYEEINSKIPLKEGKIETLYKDVQKFTKKFIVKDEFCGVLRNYIKAGKKAPEIVLGRQSEKEKKLACSDIIEKLKVYKNIFKETFADLVMVLLLKKLYKEDYKKLITAYLDISIVVFRDPPQEWRRWDRVFHVLFAYGYSPEQISECIDEWRPKTEEEREQFNKLSARIDTMSDLIAQKNLCPETEVYRYICKCQKAVEEVIEGNEELTEIFTNAEDLLGNSFDRTFEIIEKSRTKLVKQNNSDSHNHELALLGVAQ